MSDKILYIHAGLHKTGTTSIQDFCYNNNDAFALYGYNYPDFGLIGLKYFNKSYKRNGIFLTQAYRNAEGQLMPDVEREYFEIAMERIGQLFETYRCIILSDEGVFRNTAIRTPDVWEKVLRYAKRDGYTVKMIVYLRRQDEWVQSFWNQLIKRFDNKTTWENNLKNQTVYDSIDYYSILETISKHIGKGNITVRRFGRDNFLNKSIYDDFLNAIGLEMNEHFITTEERNPGLSCNVVEIKRIINTVADEDTRNFLKKALLSLDSAKNDPYCMFSYEEAAAFVDRYVEDNNRIAEEYIGDGRPLFKEVSNYKEKFVKNNELLTEDIIKAFTVITQQLLKKNKRLETQIQRLETRIRRQEKRYFRLIDLIKHPWHIFRKRRRHK